MSKLSVIKELLSNPKEIVTLGYQSLIKKRHTIQYDKNLIDKYGISQLPTIDLLDLLPGFHETIDNYSYLTNTSLVTDILMIKALSRRFKDCAYLEIGCFRGESIGCIADVVKDCTALTLSEQEMRAFEFNEGYITAHAFYSKSKPNIKTYHENSQTFDYGKLNGKKFDLIFVDGDHTYEGVLIDTKNVFQQLKDDNSIIVWHDYGYDTENVRHDVLQGIMDSTPEEYRKNLYHVSNTMCAVFIRGNFKTTKLKYLDMPNKAFQVEVKAAKL
ncbi:MAG: class I SAM-dependent methyltransferase [Taibaiella sp.]|nr:class I SAM-dependent methyltransferase [Taibaiella sp.]